MKESLELLIAAVQAHQAGIAARQKVMDHVDQIFGEFCRRKNWTKRQLSQALGVDQSMVSRLYSGYSGNLPSAKILHSMALLWAQELGEELPTDLQVEDGEGPDG